VPFGKPELTTDSVASALFYLLAYAFTNFAAWAVVIAVESRGGGRPDEIRGGLSIDDYAGLGRKNPLMAAVMAIAMFSFTGVPPTLGFVGKLFLFRTALQGGFVGLAIIGVLTSLISAYYYLRVVVVMYMHDGEPVVRSETWLNIAAVASALATLLLIIFAQPLFNWAAQAAFKLF
jgi:NADH-quinone oxidoreductase subunit N